MGELLDSLNNEQAANFDIKAAQRFAELETRKKELEAELNEVKKELDEIGGENGYLLDQMIQAGVEKLNVNGRTLYIHRQLWAGAVDGDYDAACDGLEEAGLGDYVQRRFNVHSLSAYFRERYNEDDVIEPEEIIPEPLKGKVSLIEKVKIRSRKG